MKHFGSIMNFTKQRNEDLERVFRKCILEAKKIVLSEIFAKVAESPSVRFWVSEERAVIVIKLMLANKPLPPMRDNKKEMFLEIYGRFCNMRPKYPHLSIRELVSIIINQPAPKFYLTPRTVGEMIYRIKSGWYDNYR